MSKAVERAKAQKVERDQSKATSKTAKPDKFKKKADIQKEIVAIKEAQTQSIVAAQVQTPSDNVNKAFNSSYTPGAAAGLAFGGCAEATPQK